MGRSLLQRSAAWVRALPLAGGRLALVVAILAIAQPAQAATQDYAIASAEMLNPIVVINPDDMDFGDITPRGTPGTVTLSPQATASCTLTGTILRSGPCQAARFTGTASFLFFLRATKPAGNQITLTGPAGATMLVNNFNFGGGPGTIAIGGGGPNEQRFLIINGSGNFTVYLGGRLNVAGNQRPGIYNGTVEITFNYD